MGIFEEIQKFIEDHRPCGEVTGRAQPPTVDAAPLLARPAARAARPAPGDAPPARAAPPLARGDARRGLPRVAAAPRAVCRPSVS